MTWTTQPLHVVFTVLAALGQRDLVISLRGQRQASMPRAFSTQRIAAEQLTPQLLQLAARDALGCCRLLGPVGSLMLLATVAAIAHQHTATGMAAWFGC